MLAQLAALCLLLMIAWPALAQDYNIAFNPRAVAGAPVVQTLHGGGSANPTNSATTYMFPVGFTTTAWDATAANRGMVVLPGTISDFQFVTGGDELTAGETIDATLTLGGVDTALSCQLSDAVQSCTDAGSDTIGAMGLLSLEAVVVGTIAGTGGGYMWSFKWTNGVNNQSLLMTVYNADHTAGTECGNTAANAANASVACGASTAPSYAMIAPQNFTITELHAAEVALVAGTRQIRPRVNEEATDSGCSVSIANPGTTIVSDTSCAVSIENTTPDYLGIEDVTASTPTAGFVTATMLVTSTDQNWLQGVCTASTLPATEQFTSPVGSWPFSATETARDMVTRGFTQTGFGAFVNLDPDEGAGTQTDLFALRDDTVSKVGCTLTETDTTCDAQGSEAVAAGSLIGIIFTPTNTPTAATRYCLSWSAEATP